MLTVDIGNQCYHGDCEDDSDSNGNNQTDCQG